MKKKAIQSSSILNKRATFDYELKDRYTAGLVLTGAEVSSIRRGHAHLKGAYVGIKNDELWLINATITPTSHNANSLTEPDQTRSRKLLLKQKEINELIEAKNQGKAIIPTKMLSKTRYIKIEVAVGVGKKSYDKRQTLKKRDQDREARREMQR